MAASALKIARDEKESGQELPSTLRQGHQTQAFAKHSSGHSSRARSRRKVSTICTAQSTAPKSEKPPFETNQKHPIYLQTLAENLRGTRAIHLPTLVSRRYLVFYIQYSSLLFSDIHLPRTNFNLFILVACKGPLPDTCFPQKSYEDIA